eukprot:scaffold85359_cov33-Tisochrysis_lutea.AAC.1
MPHKADEVACCAQYESDLANRRVTLLRRVECFGKGLMDPVLACLPKLTRWQVQGAPSTSQTCASSLMRVLVAHVAGLGHTFRLSESRSKGKLGASKILAEHMTVEGGATATSFLIDH